MHNFRKLDVWKLSTQLGTDVYVLCATPGRHDARVATSQLRRSALSISANIAEGCGKSTRGETIRYLEIAAGSAAETEHQLVIAARTGVLDAPTANALTVRVTSIRRMLRVLMTKLPA